MRSKSRKNSLSVCLSYDPAVHLQIRLCIVVHIRPPALPLLLSCIFYTLSSIFFDRENHPPKTSLTSPISHHRSTLRTQPPTPQGPSTTTKMAPQMTAHLTYTLLLLLLSHLSLISAAPAILALATATSATGTPTYYNGPSIVPTSERVPGLEYVSPTETPRATLVLNYEEFEALESSADAVAGVGVVPTAVVVAALVEERQDSPAEPNMPTNRPALAAREDDKPRTGVSPMHYTPSAAVAANHNLLPHRHSTSVFLRSFTHEAAVARSADGSPLRSTFLMLPRGFAHVEATAFPVSNFKLHLPTSTPTLLTRGLLEVQKRRFMPKEDMDVQEVNGEDAIATGVVITEPDELIDAEDKDLVAR